MLIQKDSYIGLVTADRQITLYSLKEIVFNSNLRFPDSFKQILCHFLEK